MADQNNKSQETIGAFAIKVEQMLCDAIGRRWSVCGMSIETLVAELAAKASTAAPAVPAVDALTDERILEIQVEHIPKTGWSTNGISFARAVEREVLATPKGAEPITREGERAEQIMALAHQWAIAAYNKALGKPFDDIDAIRRKLREVLAAAPEQAVPGDLADAARNIAACVPGSKDEREAIREIVALIVDKDSATASETSSTSVPPVPAPDQADKLLKIIACAYQVAGVHDVPEHILDVLADPEAATNEQVEAMLPYQPSEQPSTSVPRVGGDTSEDKSRREVLTVNYNRLTSGAIGTEEFFNIAFDAGQRAHVARQSQDYGLLKLTCEQLKARLAAADAHIERLEEVARQPAAATADSAMPQGDWFDAKDGIEHKHPDYNGVGIFFTLDCARAAPTLGSTPQAAELIELLKAIRPNYGDVGSRDVDVAAQQKRIDRAIELLSVGAPQAERVAVLDSRSLYVALADEPQVDERCRYFWRAGWNACRNAVLAAPVAQEADLEAPAILEAISWHARERDDLTLEEAVEAFRHGYKKVHQREDRAMLLQLIYLMASAPEAVAQEREQMGAQAAPAEVRDVALEEALRDAVIEGLRGLYGCGRVWSAWGVGTMTESDFYPAGESEEAVEQVVDAIRALRTTSTPTEGASNA